MGYVFGPNDKASRSTYKTAISKAQPGLGQRMLDTLFCPFDKIKNKTLRCALFLGAATAVLGAAGFGVAQAADWVGSHSPNEKAYYENNSARGNSNPGPNGF